MSRMEIGSYAVENSNVEVVLFSDGAKTRVFNTPDNCRITVKRIEIEFRNQSGKRKPKIKLSEIIMSSVYKRFGRGLIAIDRVTEEEKQKGVVKVFLFIPKGKLRKTVLAGFTWRPVAARNK